ncbi:MAG: penicillin-binding transpeptidase domain-containing protein [Dehalococcoidia bacterium]|nr:penicillin-binding transpeptidase domain-containing protein [Dehalococcoidia bacterium]
MRDGELGLRLRGLHGLRGGKSGTAEDAGQQQHVLFVAFRPSGAPEAVAAVVLDDGESGSLEAGPIARDILLAVP